MHNLEARGGRTFPGGPGGGHFRREVLAKDTEAWRSSLKKDVARCLSVVLLAQHHNSGSGILTLLGAPPPSVCEILLGLTPPLTPVVSR